MFKAKTGLHKIALFGKSFLYRNLLLKTILVGFIFSINLYADSQFNIGIDNSRLVSDDIYEFDIIIKSNGDAFTLTSYQTSLVFNQQAVNGGQISFSYVEGTSELSNVPAIGIGLNLIDDTPKLTFASLPGEDIINSSYIRIGHFRLQNTNSFNGSLKLSLSFNGKITTIFTGSNFADITYQLDYSENYQIVGVTASAEEDTIYGPEKAIDGLGYEDGDPYSRWAARPMPQHIIFDLGSEKSVSMTKFSFSYFKEGRIYQYTVALSNDQINWDEIVVNASSAAEEWTVNTFAPHQARYIKLLLISSNDSSKWANLWEAQIFGEGQTTSVKSEKGNGTPRNFTLSQNYPNPFNPSTSIEYELKENSKVKLTVYNILGQEVAELVNGEINAGTHKVKFNAADLASGIYVYRLDAGNKFTETKKMVLMK